MTAKQGDTTAAGETRRAETFATRSVTRIWQERPAVTNPYVAAECRCHGYDLFELVQHASYIDVLFLLFRGELPTASQTELLTKWWIAAINPGPRHPATRAAMNAAVGRTHVANLLPLSLAVLGGGHLGATEVKAAMRFLRTHLTEQPAVVVERLLCENRRPAEGDWHVAPGFGERFGSLDLVPQQTGHLLSGLAGAGPGLTWGAGFVQVLAPAEMGWLDPGVAAAVLMDLGFDEFTAVGLFQLARAPGLLAHGVEMLGQPVTAMPFPDDAHYFIEA